MNDNRTIRISLRRCREKRKIMARDSMGNASFEAARDERKGRGISCSIGSRNRWSVADEEDIYLETCPRSWNAFVKSITLGCVPCMYVLLLEKLSHTGVKHARNSLGIRSRRGLESLESGSTSRIHQREKREQEKRKLRCYIQFSFPRVSNASFLLWNFNTSYVGESSHCGLTNFYRYDFIL